MTDGAKQFTAHLLDGAEYVLNPGACFSDALDLITEAVVPQPIFTLFGRIALVGIDVAARVVWIEDLVKMLAIVLAVSVLTGG